MTLTKTEIQKQLRAIQTDLNSVRFDEHNIEHYTGFIFSDKDGNERPEKEKEDFLLHIKEENYREIVKELSHVTVTRNKYRRHFICVKRYGKLYPVIELYAFKSKEEEIVKFIYEQAEQFNNILANRYTSTEIKFPTGEIIFANFFKNNACDGYAFEVPEDVQYKEINSINHSLGEQNTMKILSDTHGLGYVQLGNTSAAVYKVSNDKIIITTCYAYYMDEEDGYERDIPIPDDWELIGEICCDVWRVEFIDKENFDKGDALPIDHEKYDHNEPISCKVNPGIWEITNRYHFIRDESCTEKGEIPIWVELDRIIS